MVMFSFISAISKNMFEKWNKFQKTENYFFLLNNATQ